MLKTSLRTSSKPPRYSCDRLSTLSMMSNLSRTQLSICEEMATGQGAMSKNGTHLLLTCDHLT
ncbi:hypothetical protein CY35_01G127000 [Sphagnum magellanicum]|nr:hypothetical protein CY35_01G127000 [Sphagnum magellanicum]